MKPGSFSQLYVQIVIVVKYRNALLKKDFRDTVFKYISGIITNNGHKTIIVNGVEDHVHIFIGLNPKESISDLVRDIKKDSSRFINQNNLTPIRFHWQSGYGAFSYSRSAIVNVYKYIENQEEHHRKKTFKDEYVELLKYYEVCFEDRFLFDFF